MIHGDKILCHKDTVSFSSFGAINAVILTTQLLEINVLFSAR